MKVQISFDFPISAKVAAENEQKAFDAFKKRHGDLYMLADKQQGDVESAIKSLEALQAKGFPDDSTPGAFATLSFHIASLKLTTSKIGGFMQKELPGYFADDVTLDDYCDVIAQGQDVMDYLSDEFDDSLFKDWPTSDDCYYGDCDDCFFDDCDCDEDPDDSTCPICNGLKHLEDEDDEDEDDENEDEVDISLSISSDSPRTQEEIASAMQDPMVEQAIHDLAALVARVCGAEKDRH